MMRVLTKFIELSFRKNSCKIPEEFQDEKPGGLFKKFLEESLDKVPEEFQEKFLDEFQE